MAMTVVRKLAGGDPQAQLSGEGDTAERSDRLTPAEQLAVCNHATIVVDRGVESLVDSIFNDLRASYRRRLIATLNGVSTLPDLLNLFAKPVDPEIVTVMLDTLVGIVTLGVKLVNETIAREHAERARDRLEIDAKTGLIAQTAFADYGPVVFNKLAEEGRLLAYIVADVDKFKKINDRQGGHAAGDYVLAELGKIIHSQLRGDDIAVRNGGDELAIVLPDTSLVEALKLAERIRRAVEFHEFIYAGQAFNVTLSMGVGTRQAGDTFAILHERTDGLSYVSKASGRNRISVAVPEGMDVSILPDFAGVTVASADIAKSN